MYPQFFIEMLMVLIYRDTYYIEANLYEFTVILALAGCYRLLCDILISSAYIVYNGSYYSKNK